MRYRRLTFLIALFAALALPLHAVAGLLMSFGGSDTLAVHALAQADPAAAMPDDCPMHQQHDHAPAQPGNCGHCGICHLASTGLIAVGEIASAPIPALETYVDALVAVPSSHIPDPPQHPPKRFV